MRLWSSNGWKNICLLSHYICNNRQMSSQFMQRQRVSKQPNFRQNLCLPSGCNSFLFRKEQLLFIVRRTCSCEDYEVLYSLVTVFSTKYFQVANSVKHSTIMDVVPECEPPTIVPECHIVAVVPECERVIVVPECHPITVVPECHSVTTVPECHISKTIAIYTRMVSLPNFICDKLTQRCYIITPRSPDVALNTLHIRLIVGYIPIIVRMTHYIGECLTYIANHIINIDGARSGIHSVFSTPPAMEYPPPSKSTSFS